LKNKRRGADLGKVRPTTGKVLESLQATLLPYVEGARVLDLFAGEGTLGRALLEAGASQVTWVEGHPKVAGSLRAEPPHRVLCARLPAGLERLEGRYDIILGDPPYGSPEGPVTLQAALPWLAPEGWLVWEHHHKDAYPEALPGMELWRRKRFGETALSYWRCHR
jgi:16S rRNA (guanine966-N2)-methyltransferase